MLIEAQKIILQFATAVPQTAFSRTFLLRYKGLQVLYLHLNHKLNDDDMFKWVMPADISRTREDSMLLLGAFLYGFGNWRGMKQDSRLHILKKTDSYLLDRLDFLLRALSSKKP